MRVLLVGGNGFIGSPLVRELVAAGHELGVFHRRPPAHPEPSSVQQILGDRNRLSSYQHEIREFRPDVIVEPLPLTEDSALRRTRRLYSAEGIQVMQAIFEWVNESYDKIAVEETIMGSAEVSATILRLPRYTGREIR